jgi:hypothetical protein
LNIPPGPAYTNILVSVLNARLDNIIETKEDEINFVKSLLDSQKSVPSVSMY